MVGDFSAGFPKGAEGALSCGRELVSNFLFGFIFGLAAGFAFGAGCPADLRTLPAPVRVFFVLDFGADFFKTGFFLAIGVLGC